MNRTQSTLRKTLALLLTLVMLLGVMPFAELGTVMIRAQAADAGEPAAGEPAASVAAAGSAAIAATPRRAAAAEPTWVEVGKEKKHEDRMKKADHAADLSLRIPHKARGTYRHFRQKRPAHMGQDKRHSDTGRQAPGYERLQYLL
ncbi:MAG: hypothetical protein L6V84_00745 [Oscillospiraceae bacterium]|nr:MAG: hypothetical protein L6V84_00745 [Oscillospiraceae bacterium]